MFLKGIIIGIGKIIPGFSGSMMMMVFGLYEKTILILCNFFDDVSKNTKFLFILGSGVLIAIILMSKLMILVLINYYYFVIYFFTGLILGGFPLLLKQVKGSFSKKNMLIFFGCFFFLFSFFIICNQKQLSLGAFNNKSLLFFLIGIIEAGTMIVPGISGTAILILLGCYNTLLELFSNLSNFSFFFKNINLFMPFLLGILIGGAFFIKLMEKLLINYNKSTYWGIIGLALSSVIIMFFANVLFSVGGLILLFSGFLISLLLNN